MEEYHRVDRSIREVNMLQQELKVLEGPLKNVWIWGPTGTGKSRWARDKWPKAYLKSADKWWGYYAHQPEVLIEELGPRMIGAHHIKKWADRYPVKVEAK